MTAAQPATLRPLGTPPRPRAQVDYAITGDLRFLSHHDELRMLTRALVRARWPLAYSQGFNPAPRITLPLPRGLGIACDTQLAVVTLREPQPADDLHTALARTLPGGCTVRRVTLGILPGLPRAVAVHYEVDLTEAEAATVVDRLPHVRGAAPLVVTRDDGPERPGRPVDIRPYLATLDLAGRRLRLELHVVNQRTARPAEVLTALGLDAGTCNHRVRRGEIRWEFASARPVEGPALHERNCIGKQTDEQEEQGDG